MELLIDGLNGENIVSYEEARKHIEIAQRHLDRVQGASLDVDPDPELAVTFAFYAYECCVVAVAEFYSRRWTTNHGRKAQLAGELHAEGLVSRDIEGELQRLNELRKDVAYDQPGPELHELNLADLAAELETFIDEVELLVGVSP